MPAPQQTGLVRIALRRLGDPIGGGTIEEITSSDGSVVVTNPNGPITDLSVQGGAGERVTLAIMNYGSGDPETPDSGLPVYAESVTEFYLSTQTNADTAEQFGDVTFFPVGERLTRLRLLGWIDRAQLPTAGGTVTMTFTVKYRDLFGTINDGPSKSYTAVLLENESFDVSADVDLAPGYAVGVKVDFTAELVAGGILRASCRLEGRTAGQVFPPTGAEIIWDTDHVVTDPDDGDLIAEFTDQSGFGNDATQPLTGTDYRLGLGGTPIGTHPTAPCPPQLFNAALPFYENTTLLMHNRGYTVAAIFRLTNTAGGGIFRKQSGNDGFQNADMLWIHDGHQMVEGDPDGGNNTWATTSADYLGVPILFVLRVDDDGYVRVWINGTEIPVTQATPLAAYDFTGCVFLNRRSLTGTHDWSLQGEFAMFRRWPTALAAIQIADLWAWAQEEYDL